MIIPLPGNDSGGTLPFEGSQHIADIMRHLIESYDIKTFVETGTQRGATTLWASKLGLQRIVTIEADEDYFEEAARNFANTPGINQRFGDSAVVLADLSFHPQERVLFFLDAHGCRIGGTPIVGELLAIREAINRQRIEPIITIHDVQVPGRDDLGYDLYENGALSTKFLDDVLYVTAFAPWTVRYNTIADGAARGFAYITPK